MSLEPEGRTLPDRPDVALRVLRPPKCQAVYLHMHPGGLVLGAPAMSDPFNLRVANELSIAVVSVDYRLAPRHPMPAAVDDCEAAARWLLAHSQREFGTDHWLIGGESAGASLAVLTLLRMRDRLGACPFRAANLAVGTYDFSRTPSQRRSTDALFLSPERLRQTVESAFPGMAGEALRVPEISSLYADLRGLAPAIFSIGTEDAVLDDSLFMAARWRAAGNEAELELCSGGTHLFLNEPGAFADEGSRRILDFLRRHA
ncbi:MAG TPA: alpha/beta hydrolase fold domain-containing protein [Steroidobacteraceae bacterium]|nr:alpha/beta hydrolase fold domain-containing protein [Steroidobacteraceae bacterium]